MKRTTLFILFLSAITLNSFAKTEKPAPFTNQAIQSLAKKFSNLPIQLKTSTSDTKYCAGVVQALAFPDEDLSYISQFYVLIVNKMISIDPTLSENQISVSYNNSLVLEIVYVGSSIELTSYFPDIFAYAQTELKNRYHISITYTITFNSGGCTAN
jgi:hypothetical protein